MITCLGLSPALDISYGLPEVEVGRIHRPSWVVELPGGKSLNVARALAVLGQPVRAIAPLGGPVGQVMAEALVAAGIEVEQVPVSATRRCVSAFSQNDGSATEFYEPALPLDDAAWQRLCTAVEHIDGGWLAVSGSVPADRVGPLADVVAAASARGVRVALDVHGPALAAVLAAAPIAVVKVNRAEAVDLLGDGPAAALAGGLRRAGAGLAVVTDGATGAVALGEDGGALWATPGQPGRYAVGSGDCFLAGLLAELCAGGELRAALALATAAAAANTRVPGAARFTRADVDRALRQVDIRSEA
ncbi:MAG: PfkB family carbohydrate kinase [Propionicimonas sp.]|uniref:1-phosphofructokinase family hexose kinase n=1 Tax=Propionicimonas sp. TaxID=1955623 RepID=UPI002B1FAB18|nr:PfkB family carbohydrate kinase [Propionicimonas sp.]MEA4942802.1 PfkB family carbohydrate kinase [Propionicimonas sp.]